jgi:protein phosphatase
VTLSLRFAARSDVGLLRDLNEDSMYAGPRLLAIADGMGGHAAGEVASRVAIESVAPLDDDNPGADLIGSLRDAVESASGYLQDMVAADNALDGMGTTLTALLFAGQRLGLVHIGDSRCYLLRDGELAQITHDHTLVQHLVDEGRITPEEATTHPQRSWITRSLTGRGELELDLSIREVRAGDRYLLCSDGLSGPVSQDTIADTLRSAPDAQAACEQLVELALRAGGPDNVSAIVADVVETEAELGGTPIVGGAAADAPQPAADDEDTPATRAANIGRRRRRGPRGANAAAIDGAGDEEDDSDGVVDTSRRRSRLPLVIALVVLLVVLAGIGTWLYTRSQYYVGEAKGTPPTVGVYRGVSGSLLGVNLSSLDERSDVPVSALPDFEQVHVRNGIDASSRNDARQILARLRSDACPAASAAPTPAASPTGKATPSPAATSPPTPAYCHG